MLLLFYGHDVHAIFHYIAENILERLLIQMEGKLQISWNSGELDIL